MTFVQAKGTTFASGAIALLAGSVSETGGAIADLLKRHEHDGSRSWIVEREALIAGLTDLYRGITPSVVSFLRANSDLAWTLRGAKAALTEAFGLTARFRLAVITDVDANETRRQLFVYISTAVDVDRASRALDAFDRDWFIDRSAALAGRLEFDLEF